MTNTETSYRNPQAPRVTHVERGANAEPIASHWPADEDGRQSINARSHALARRLEDGAIALAELAATLTDAEWQTHVPGDGRTVGVIVHHVANMYPLEIQLASLLAAGQPITGVTWDDVHALNAAHAAEHRFTTNAEATALLLRTSAAAAGAIRALSDQELDRAAPVSLNANAPLTCQFFLEDHAVRHSYHHLARLRTALQR